MNLADELPDNSRVGDRQDEQAVVICLQFPIGKLQEKAAHDAVVDLGEIFNTVMESSGVGTYKGHELSEGAEEEMVTYYLFGDDVGLIYDEIQPIFHLMPNLTGFYIIKRYSAFNDKQFHIEQ